MNRPIEPELMHPPVGRSSVVGGRHVIDLRDAVFAENGIGALVNLALSGTLAVAGASALHATTVTGTFSTSSTATLASAVITAGITVGTTLAVTGASTLAAVACTTLAASSNATVGGTLAITGTTTAAAVNATAVAASSSLTVTGASIVGLHENLTVDVPSLDFASPGTYGIPCPVAGTVTKIYTRLKGALAAGDATLTAKIGSTAMTNGVVTITEAGSAAGDIDSATPTALNTVVEGSNLCVTVGGSNNAAVGATVVFQIRRSA